MTDEIEVDNEAANNLANLILTALEGQQVGDVLYALEKTVSAVLLAHCTSLPAAKETLKVLNDNIWDYVKFVDKEQLASWNSRALN